MLKLTFNQPSSELLVRAASTLLFHALEHAGFAMVALSELTEPPQYGFTASASWEPTGPRYVRITDLQHGAIDWDTVPFCDCPNPSKYILRPGDLLFARTGATTGKTHLVGTVPDAVFASYLIRLRPHRFEDAEYLYAFFQSDLYWMQVMDQKAGSAQANVNGEKLISIRVPKVDPTLCRAIAGFIAAVRRRQAGDPVQLPCLPSPLTDLRPVVAKIELLQEKVEEANTLRRAATDCTERLVAAEEFNIWSATSLTVASSLGQVTNFLARGRQTKQGTSSHYLIKTQHVQMGRYVESAMTLSPEAASKVDDEALARSGDTLIACSAAGCLGRVAFYSDGTRRASTDSHVAIARPCPDIVSPEYLYAYLRGAQGQVQLRSREKGDWKREKVGFRLTELNVADMRKVPVPVPPTAEQRRIVEYVEKVRSRVDSMKDLQVKTAAELDALLPAVLDRAFRGEL